MSDLRVGNRLSTSLRPQAGPKAMRSFEKLIVDSSERKVSLLLAKLRSEETTIVCLEAASRGYFLFIIIWQLPRHTSRRLKLMDSDGC